MAIPLKQAIAVGKYIMKQRLKRTKRYPLVTMLEPLFRCNLEWVQIFSGGVKRRDCARFEELTPWA